jgi:hypothetical protein
MTVAASANDPPRLNLIPLPKERSGETELISSVIVPIRCEQAASECLRLTFASGKLHRLS